MPYVFRVFFITLLLGQVAHADPQSNSRFIAEQSVTPETLSITFEAFAPVLVQVVTYQLEQNGIILSDPESFANEISTEFEGAYLEELRAQTAALQLEVFTPEELEGIAAFYGTPAGQALVRNTPVLAARGQQVGEQIGVAALQDAGFRLADRMVTEGLSFTDDPMMGEKLLDLLQR